jgi:putative ABC transport system permease protein
MLQNYLNVALRNLRKQKAYSFITLVSASSALPIGWDPQQQVLPEGVAENEKLNMNVYGIDYDFIEMLNMEILQGRAFSHDFSDTDSLILNETAVRQLQWDDTLGRQLTIGDQKGTVIGAGQIFGYGR